MAGSASNWFRPQSGPLAGQAVYVSKAGQAGFSRQSVLNRLTTASPGSIKPLNTYPAGAMRPQPKQAPAPAPAPPAGPSKTVPAGQTPVRQGSHGTVYQAPNGQFGVYDNSGNLVKTYASQGGATRAMNKLAPPAPAQAASTAQPSPATQAAGAPGPGKASPTWYPAKANVPPWHVKTYQSTKQRLSGIVSQMKQAAKSFTSAEKTAIQNYQDGLGWSLQTLNPSQAGMGQGVYQAVNRKMRGHHEPDPVWNSLQGKQAVNRIIRDLGTAIQKSSVPEDTIAFRGIRSGGDRNGVFAKGYRDFKTKVYDNWQVGQTYQAGSAMTDKAYTSTTLDRSVAEKVFTKGSQAGIVIEYRIPKGTRGVAMSATNSKSRFNDTAEILLDKGLGYTVVSKYQDPATGRLHAVLEITP